MNYPPDSLRDRTFYRTQTSVRGRLRALPHWLILVALPVAGLVFLSLSSNDANALRIKEAPLALPAVSSYPAQEKVVQLPVPAVEATAESETTTEPEATGDAIEAAAAETTAAALIHKTVTVKKGDSLAKIFAREQLDPQQLHAVLNSAPLAKKLTNIHPGQQLAFLTDTDSKLQELRYILDPLNTIQVKRTDDRFDTQLITKVPERRKTSKAGVIDSSLFLAAQKASLPEKVTMELANIFGWDVDFALDIRKGDSFAVVYEELYLDGEKIGPGNIIAAEFTNRGKTHKAVRFADSHGNVDFYTPKGRSLRKAFIRTPVSFTRISSRFSLGRKHPILNRIRAHKGVDYAAPRGTPVKATGNGKIVFRGKKGGYGNVIIIKHGSKYSTLYGHLSRYRRSLKTGSRVQQGQIIAYVGSSGLATGPHLHYEFRVNGVHRNPLTVKLPSASPLPKKYRDEFKQVTASSLALLELAKNEAVAFKE